VNRIDSLETKVSAVVTQVAGIKRTLSRWEAKQARLKRAFDTSGEEDCPDDSSDEEPVSKRAKKD